ncbi:MAG: VWA domain-containing protein [Ignavibacteriales bacterium]|nr:VWA domain-containing protein [Ignavibacteriales bacterium]
MKKIIVIATFALVATASISLRAAHKPTEETDGPKVQLAILLDTSGSMDGLIEQAKAKLWKIVNELALSKKNGETIELSVALYEYGKDDVPEEMGYVRRLAPLTTDLDLISEKLFELQTNGGSEYCGEVIKRATDDLDWSDDPEDLKLIFIAGNEEFTQGEIDYKTSCKDAIEEGIIVNTIFCGDFNEGVETMWKDGADLADGEYMNIDHNQAVADPPTPYDDELVELNEELNDTYLPYGSVGRMKKEAQEEQDANAAGVGAGTMAERAAAKSTSQYRNSGWDLVDAAEDEALDVAEIEEEELPEEMRDMTDDEKRAYVEEMSKKRGDVQDRIAEVNKKRREYIAEQRKQDAEEKSLDEAMIEAVRKQATRNDFTFDQ